MDRLAGPIVSYSSLFLTSSRAISRRSGPRRTCRTRGAGRVAASHPGASQCPRLQARASGSSSPRCPPHTNPGSRADHPG
eukprot:397395-Rhodomonas_salina.2